MLLAVNRDTRVSGETLNALLIICLELEPIFEALCLVWVKNRRRRIETAVRHSSLKLSGHVSPRGRGQETPQAVEVQRLQGLFLTRLLFWWLAQSLLVSFLQGLTSKVISPSGIFFKGITLLKKSRVSCLSCYTLVCTSHTNFAVHE